MTVPAPAGAAGPALKFWYRAQAMPNASAHASTAGSYLTLPEGVGWMEQTLCLDPRQVGRPATVRIGGGGPGGLCANTFPAERFWIDDVRLTTDAACPGG